MAQRAVARLAKKLDKEAERGGSVEIGEEMRHLTLQVRLRLNASSPSATRRSRRMGFSVSFSFLFFFFSVFSFSRFLTWIIIYIVGRAACRVAKRWFPWAAVLELGPARGMGRRGGLQSVRGRRRRASGSCQVQVGVRCVGRFGSCFVISWLETTARRSWDF